MALIKCPECGKEISEKAKACPNCGLPLEVSSGEQNVSENKDTSTIKKTNKKILLIVATICLICVVTIVGIILLPNHFYELSDETIGITVSEKDIEKYLENDAYVYSGDMLDYSYEKRDLIVRRTIIMEDNEFPTEIIGIAEKYGYTYGEMLDAYGTKICNTPDECKMLGESQFKEQLDAAINAYGNSYVYTEEEIGYGTHENYKWYLDNDIYYSLSISNGTKYYPAFNQYIISYGYFLD